MKKYLPYLLLAAFAAAAILGAVTYKARSAARSSAWQEYQETFIKPQLEEIDKRCAPDDALCRSLVLTKPVDFSYEAGWPMRFAKCHEPGSDRLNPRRAEIEIVWAGLAADFLLFFGAAFVALLAVTALDEKRRSRGPEKPPAAKP